MKALSHSDIFHLQAAQGWLELENPWAADEELTQITPYLRHHPAVLEVRWKIHASSRHWRTCLNIADALTQDNPSSPAGWICLSLTLHKLKLTEEAWETLFEVVDDFPDIPAIPYELARYSCLLGLFPEACHWLEQACSAGDSTEVQLMALEDPDLRPLWDMLALEQ